jgi:simple sugar transport system permease protein
MAGGMAWSGIAGILKNKANMNETITTLILNYIAFQAVSYFVFGLLKDPASFNWPQSPPIADSLRLPRLGSSKVSAAIIIALAAAVLVWLVLKKTTWGHKIRVIGGNPSAALHAGYDVMKNRLLVMMLSGALSGLAGMLEICAVEDRLRQSTGVNYGYLGFLAAWMAWNNPLLCVFTAFTIGLLSVAGNTLEITSGLPSSSVRILMSVVLLAILWKGRRKAQ